MFMGLLLQYRDARRARANISRGMQYYLPDKIARGFAGGGRSERKGTSLRCAWSPTRRASTLAEGMTPEALSAVLDQYFAILFGVVERHGGLVTDVVGDGTTSVWTAPRPDRASRLGACRAALEISRAIDAFNQRSTASHDADADRSECRWAMVGNVGGSGHYVYSVVGDCVNTASRLESLNKQLGTRIIAARALVEDLEEIVSRRSATSSCAAKARPCTWSSWSASPPKPSGPGRCPISPRRSRRSSKAAGASRRSFARVLASNPSDGPARFYQTRCGAT